MDRVGWGGKCQNLISLRQEVSICVFAGINYNKLQKVFKNVSFLSRTPQLCYISKPFPLTFMSFSL